MDADEIIARLGLAPHPEGGHYRETWRAGPGPDGRSHGTAIYFLLRSGEHSHWHRVPQAEIWLFHGGAPLRLDLAGPQGERQELILGMDLEAGQEPQRTVPPGWWQRARSLGEWTLVGCTLAPGFEFADFELAPEGWDPS